MCVILMWTKYWQIAKLKGLCNKKGNFVKTNLQFLVSQVCILMFSSSDQTVLEVHFGRLICHTFQRCKYDCFIIRQKSWMCNEIYVVTEPNVFFSCKWHISTTLEYVIWWPLILAVDYILFFIHAGIVDSYCSKETYKIIWKKLPYFSRKPFATYW
jgi:hypothetical protein